MPEFRSACPMDCWDACALIVSTDAQGKITGIKGDPHHPVTKGFVCAKIAKLAQAHCSSRRLTSPLLKIDGKHRPIGWSQAIEIMVDKLRSSIRENGNIVYYTDSGSTGALKGLEKRFFNQLPGVTRARGSLCWGAGLRAQQLDFGASLSHPPQDILNAKTIILWGRNPAWTNIHLLPWLNQARALGSKIILIDPLKSATADLPQVIHLAPRPGSDGWLALGLARELIHSGIMPLAGTGLEKYRALCSSISLEDVLQETGLSKAEFKGLLEMLTNSPVQIWLGYGLQRYFDSVTTIRHIDALAALLGSIGIPGGGVNYAHTWWDDLLAYQDLVLKPNYPIQTFAKSRVGSYLVESKPELVFITRANPAVQAPAIMDVQQGLSQAGFTVVFEHFYTDTARHAHLVLPATGFLEESDLYLSNMWHGYMNYAQPILAPPGEARPEREVFQLLAQVLGLDFPKKTDDQWLYELLKPAEAWGITLEKLKKQSLGHPEFIPWQDSPFATPDQAFNYVADLPKTSRPPTDKIRLLSPHRATNMHSQLFEPGPQEHILQLHPETGHKWGVVDGGLAQISSQEGTIRCRIELSSDIAKDLGLLPQGAPCWGTRMAVNVLTPSQPTSGDGAAYNECFCWITPLEDQ